MPYVAVRIYISCDTFINRMYAVSVYERFGRLVHHVIISAIIALLRRGTDTRSVRVIVKEGGSEAGYTIAGFASALVVEIGSSSLVVAASISWGCSLSK
jgi:hypothetical protein